MRQLHVAATPNVPTATTSRGAAGLPTGPRYVSDGTGILLGAAGGVGADWGSGALM